VTCEGHFLVLHKITFTHGSLGDMFSRSWSSFYVLSPVQGAGDRQYQHPLGWPHEE
jgi:hypothetical protein